MRKALASCAWNLLASGVSFGHYTIGICLMFTRPITTGLLFLICATPAWAQEAEFSISGQVDLGLRHYTQDGAFAGQKGSSVDPFAGLRIDGTLAVGSGEAVLQFSHLQDERNDRSFSNLQKAYYTNNFGNWDIVLGYNIEDWGVSSGRTTVNVLNARNQTNQLGRSDRIGTPMVNANVFTDIGTFSLYALGGEVRDNFGGRATRQRGPIFTDDRLTRYEDDDSLDVALRFTKSYTLGDGSLDIGASVYDGTNREAVLLGGCVQADATVSRALCDQANLTVQNAYEAGSTPIESAIAAGIGSLTALTPYYQEIRQYGLTAVYAQGDTQLRFEGFVREASGESFNAAIIGGDQTFYNAFGGDGTLVAAVEYHYDDRSDRQPVTIYDDDLFLGVNYAHNDTSDTKMDFGLFVDLNEASKIYTMSISRRLGDRFRVGLTANHILSDSDTDPLASADNDSYFEMSVSTFF